MFWPLSWLEQKYSQKYSWLGHRFSVSLAQRPSCLASTGYDTLRTKYTGMYKNTIKIFVTTGRFNVLTETFFLR